jgi:hypothetical protein
LDRALAHDVGDRFQDATAMRDAIDAELKRMGVTSPRGEIEAFFDDPKGYAERHKRQTIEKLCELAGKSRKDGNSLSAAADYNRALAYAPEDRELLRVVTSLHRAEARRRMVKRLVPPIFGAIAIGALAFAVTRFAKEEVKADYVPSTKPTTHASATASAPVTITSAIPSTTTTAVAITPPPIKSAAPKPTDRAIVFASVKPENGVIVSVDGTSVLNSPPPNSKLTLDLQEHTLKFTCSQDFCVPQEKDIAAGDQGDTIAINLTIRPATLQVNGDVGSSYRITEEPELAVVAGTPVKVRMGSAYMTIHVVNLANNKSREYSLVAGKTLAVDFNSENQTP